MSNKIIKVFGKNLKKFRKKRNLTQEELAFKANLNRTYIGRIERGERNISLAVAERIANALQIDIKEFFTE